MSKSTQEKKYTLLGFILVISWKELSNLVIIIGKIGISLKGILYLKPKNILIHYSFIIGNFIVHIHLVVCLPFS